MSIGDSLRFLRAFAGNPAHIGAIAPSSPALARAMVAGLAPAPGEAIVEYGPGTGPFTEEIAKVLPEGCAYLGIERDAQFIALLRERYPGLRFAHGSAEDVIRLCREAGVERVAAIISGLPFASLPTEVQAGILDGLNQLMVPGRVFRTFQYVHSYPLPKAVRFRRRMRAMFGPAQRQGPIWANMPPAFVLSWRRQ